MSLKMFAAIDVGSYELTCKIFEYSPKNGMKAVDVIHHRLALGNDTFATGKVSQEKVNELCKVLQDFSQIMKSYGVEAYRAYGTSAIRETKNATILLDQIAQRTGIRIGTISNSEQRFLGYKAIASKGEDFNQTIEKGTVILDIGGGSIQISLFNKDTLMATQNLKLGVLRLRESLSRIDVVPSKQDSLLEEMISAQLSVVKKMYMKDKEIETIIVVDDYVPNLLQQLEQPEGKKGFLSLEQFENYWNEMHTTSVEVLSKKYGMPEENIGLLSISSAVIRRLAKMMEAKQLWVPGVTLCDGIGYEYGESKGLLKPDHDFEQDIVACAQNISKRYMGSKKRGETLEKITTNIFDHMKKIHGMGDRERLLLRLAAILHDCGKYISMSNLGECSYNIILSTEIIGLSHREREILANVVKFNHVEFVYENEIGRETDLSKEDYLLIAKLTAILKVANGLDRSHKQKFKDTQVSLKDNTLVFTVATAADISLEKGLFSDRAAFFEEVYNMKPVIKQKKIMVEGK